MKTQYRNKVKDTIQAKKKYQEANKGNYPSNTNYLKPIRSLKGMCHQVYSKGCINLETLDSAAVLLYFFCSVVFLKSLFISWDYRASASSVVPDNHNAGWLLCAYKVHRQKVL